MESSSCHMILYFLVVWGCIIIPTSSQSHPQQPPPQKRAALFIFGDSYFDAGNNNYIDTPIEFRGNHWPFGETFFGYPTGRITDGRTIPDFIAEYAGLPYIPPYLQPGNDQFSYGANFASAGAGALDETYKGLVVGLNTQLSYFKDVGEQLRQKLGDEAAEKILFEAVYLFSIGTNDYLNPFTPNSTVSQSYSQEQYIHMVVGNLTGVILEIYKEGGRKFGLNNLGPLGCLPVIKEIKLKQGGAGECIEEATQLGKLHNMALSKALQKLKIELEGFKYSISDIYNLLEERMANPSKYGFKEGKKACCGSGHYRGLTSCGKKTIKEYQLCSNVSEYVFFDGAHPTDKANQQMAELMWKGTGNVTTPNNLEAFFGLGQECPFIFDTHIGYDFYTTLEERMDNPSKYGFKDGKTACCGSGPYRALVSCGGEGKTKEYELCSNTKEYVFFDGVHPTDKANQQMAKLMWSGAHNITRPYNLKQLFS